MTELWDAMAVLEGSKPTHKHKAVSASVLNPYAEEKRKAEEAAAAAAAQIKAAEDAVREEARQKLLKEAASSTAMLEFSTAIEDAAYRISLDCENLAKGYLSDAAKIARHLPDERKQAVEDGYIKVLNASINKIEHQANKLDLTHLAAVQLKFIRKIKRKLPRKKWNEACDLTRAYNAAIERAIGDAGYGFSYSLADDLKLARKLKRRIPREKRKALCDLTKVYNAAIAEAENLDKKGFNVSASSQRWLARSVKRKNLIQKLI